MSFNCVAFGIYMDHCTDEDNVCKLIFKSIKINDQIYKEDSYAEIVDTSSQYFELELNDDIVCETPLKTFPRYNEENGQLYTEENKVFLSLNKEATLRSIIKCNYLDPIELRFVFENDIEFKIGYPHKCSFMIYPSNLLVDQWYYQRAFITEKEMTLLYQLRERLIKEGRLKEQYQIGLVADCCL